MRSEECENEDAVWMRPPGAKRRCPARVCPPHLAPVQLYFQPPGESFTSLEEDHCTGDTGNWGNVAMADHCRGSDEGIQWKGVVEDTGNELNCFGEDFGEEGEESWCAGEGGSVGVFEGDSAGADGGWNMGEMEEENDQCATDPYASTIGSWDNVAVTDHCRAGDVGVQWKEVEEGELNVLDKDLAVEGEESGWMGEGPEEGSVEEFKGGSGGADDGREMAEREKENDHVNFVNYDAPNEQPILLGEHRLQSSFSLLLFFAELV